MSALFKLMILCNSFLFCIPCQVSFYRLNFMLSPGNVFETCQWQYEKKTAKNYKLFVILWKYPLMLVHSNWVRQRKVNARLLIVPVSCIRKSIREPAVSAACIKDAFSLVEMARYDRVEPMKTLHISVSSGPLINNMAAPIHRFRACRQWKLSNTTRQWMIIASWRLHFVWYSPW